ncbi:uncharacterized protein LOC123676816 [Harmonia axyridis]|uniref:uncharacterized protein LOC123676816 n=1 Tax=Harmonia axyridis TaxID=115357 RepID=UPI001E27677F|nr:uncharacterized protein LOC123676816 [Harmonia axyridis]
MLWRGILFVVSLNIIDKVHADTAYISLDEFVQSVNSSLIVELQENSHFLAEVVTGLIRDAKAFIMSNFGYNRLILAKKVEKSIEEINKIPQSKSEDEHDKICFGRNRGIMFFLLREATMDWHCLETSLFSTLTTAVGILSKLLQLKDIPFADCNLGILCFITKGFSGMTLGASLSADLVELGLTATNFFTSIKRCQRRIKPFEEAYDISLENIKRCVATKSIATKRPE